MPKFAERFNRALSSVEPDPAAGSVDPEGWPGGWTPRLDPEATPRVDPERPGWTPRLDTEAGLRGWIPMLGTKLTPRLNHELDQR